MIGSLNDLAVATATFVGSHFILASVPVQRGISERIGANVFRGLFSVVALATFAWMLLAFSEAPHHELWAMTPALRHITFVIMPIAVMLVVIGLTTRNVTSVGGEGTENTADIVQGIVTVTRHPFLWGVTLWGIAHIFSNGDVASLILFGGMVILSVGGMAHIDHRRRESMGAAWGPVALTSSAIPFLAALQKRTKIDWMGIGLARPVVGMVLFAILLFAHEYVIGVPLIPHY